MFDDDDGEGCADIDYDCHDDNFLWASSSRRGTFWTVVFLLLVIVLLYWAYYHWY